MCPVWGSGRGGLCARLKIWRTWFDSRGPHIVQLEKFLSLLFGLNHYLLYRIVFKVMENVKILWCERHGWTEHVFYSGRYRCKKCYTYYNAEKRKRYKKELVEYKGGKCEICGYDKCISALEFHHTDATKKDFSISETTFSKSMDILKKEVDKCILVCANCHREIHEKEREELLNNMENYKKDCDLRKRAINKINENEFLGLLEKGYSLKKLSEYYNVSISTIKRYKQILKENNRK